MRHPKLQLPDSVMATGGILKIKPKGSSGPYLVLGDSGGTWQDGGTKFENPLDGQWKLAGLNLYLAAFGAFAGAPVGRSDTPQKWTLLDTGMLRHDASGLLLTNLDGRSVLGKLGTSVEKEFVNEGDLSLAS